MSEDLLPSVRSLSPRDLYLDLMKRVLVNVIYRDPSVAPWRPPEFDLAARLGGEDWPRDAHSMVGMKRLNNLQACCAAVMADGIPGDFVETGVWRGGASIFLRSLLAAYGDLTRRVWVADSFAGLPPPNPEKYPADRGDKHHTVEFLAISLEQVQEHFRRYGLLDEQVRFLKGWFSETLPTAPIEQVAILRLDGDMYESTMDALTALYDRVAPGGFVIIDDYKVIPSCKQAVHDFCASRGFVPALTEIDWAGVFWRKR